MALFAVYCAWYVLLNHDVGAYFSYAGRVLAGERLYIDIIEVNTPLMTYLLMPLVALKQNTDIPYTDSFFVVFGLVFFACILFSLHLLNYFEGFRQPRSRLIAGGALCYILLLSTALERNFGQREHFLICLIFPYIVTLMAMDNKTELPRNHRLVAGLLAGIGFSIKPNFIIIFICGELASLAMRRNLLGCFRIETWSIGFIFTGYHLWFFLTFPEYFHQLPYFMDVYKGYQSPFILTLAKMLLSLSVFYLYIIPIIKFKIDLSKVATLIALILGSCLHYLIQNIGLSYHLIPAYSLMLWLGVVLLINTNKQNYIIWILLISAMPYGLKLLNIEERRSSIQQLANAIESHAAGKSVAILSTSVYPTFSAMSYAQAQWPLSVACLVQLPINYTPASSDNFEPNYRTLDEMDDTERYFTSRNLSELEERPKLIVIDEREEKQGLENVQFNILNYFLAQERFRKLWKDYRYIGTLHDFAFYKYEPAAKP